MAHPQFINRSIRSRLITRPIPRSYEVYGRDENLARPWAVPGTAGLEHRIGGLEKQNITGNVSYDPENHQEMTDLRRQKIEKVCEFLPPLEPQGSSGRRPAGLGLGRDIWLDRDSGRQRPQRRAQRFGGPPAVSQPTCRKIWARCWDRFKKVLIPELNDGQLRMLIRAKYLVDAKGLNKVQGKPFLIEEIEQAITLMLDGTWGDRESLTPRGHRVTVEN